MTPSPMLSRIDWRIFVCCRKAASDCARASCCRATVSAAAFCSTTLRACAAAFETVILKLRGFPGFGYISKDLTAIHGPDQGVDVRITRHQNPGGVRYLLGFGEELIAGEPRHSLIRQDYRKFRRVQQLKGFFTAAAGDHLEVLLQQIAHGIQNARLIVNHQDHGSERLVSHAFPSGSNDVGILKMNSVPFPTSLETSIEPR